MPNSNSILSKYANPPRPQPSSDRTRTQRNRLKKRLPFAYSGTNLVSYDLSKLMGNHHSIHDVPRPSRPPRPSTTDIPDLPGLPIYKTFASEFQPTTFLVDKSSVQNDEPSESATGWVLANSPSTPPCPRTRPPRPLTAPRAQSEATSVTIQAPPRPDYDRASRLAESYQSLLPDLDSMDYPESHTALHRQQSDQRLREHWDDQRPTQSLQTSSSGSPHRLRHTAPRPGTAPATPVAEFWRPPLPPGQDRYPPRRLAGGTHSRRTPSIVTDTSSTAVESDVSPLDGFSTAGDVLTPRTTITNSSASHSDCSEPGCPSPRHRRNSDSQKDVDSHVDRPRPPRMSSSDYVGLQICAELLTDELIKTFFRRHPSEKRGRASKLQVLLLIEAYEAMLDNCRRELLKTPVFRSQSAEKERERAQRRRHVRDAVRILDHWLDSLYVIYDETFGDVDGDEDPDVDFDNSIRDGDDVPPMPVVQGRIGGVAKAGRVVYGLRSEEVLGGDMGVAF